VEDWRNGGFGLYIHWPFCESKCPYCDFNSHVSKQIDQTAWTEAFLHELDRVAALTRDRVLDSVYFGGGTPSLMAPELVDALVTRIRKHWSMANAIEITLEANPGSVETGRFTGFREAGVNRVSLGVQALNDRDLRALGRLHSAREARDAFDVARSVFDRVSFDLIYGRQSQSLSDWAKELATALSMAVDHLSLYQLTVETGTPFAARFAAGGLKGLPSEDLGADLYAVTQDMCGAAGLPAYEISNHARPGCESRHNLIYWMGGDYVGIGPGAHGRLTRNGQRFATEAISAPAIWLAAVPAQKTELGWEKLCAQDRADEYLMMGLRLVDGVDLDRYARMLGRPLAAGKVAELETLGLLELNGSHLRTTDQGRLVLNAVLIDLLVSA